MKEIGVHAPVPVARCRRAAVGGKGSKTARRPPLSQGHDDVALADINDIKALFRVGNTWIHAAVAAGSFPAPVIKSRRFTRWLLADVKANLAARVQGAA